MKSCSVAVVGATGKVGKEMLNTLARRKFPADEIVPLASGRSKGLKVGFGENEILEVSDLADFDFSKVDIALFSAGSDISKVYAPRAANNGCVVIDNTPFFRLDKDVPLIVPEVNLEFLGNYRKKNIIANPNCAAIQLLVAIYPIHLLYKIKKVVLSTYQSVSGAGKEAMDELYNQTKGKFSTVPVPGAERKVFEKQIAFNCIPKIGEFDENGSTGEESKIINEVRKVLNEDIHVVATCVRVPVFLCHGEAVYLECEKKINFDDAEYALSEAEGLQLLDWDSFCTPIEATGEDGVFVSRIRKDLFADNALSMWVLSDNLRKGAALNAVQIAEILLRDFL